MPRAEIELIDLSVREVQESSEAIISQLSHIVDFSDIICAKWKPAGSLLECALSV